MGLFSSLFIPCFVDRFLEILLQPQVAQELCQKGECWTAIRFTCWLTTLNSIFRSADTALVDQGADRTDEQVQTKIFTFDSKKFTILGRAGNRFKIKLKSSTHTQNPLLVFVPLPLPTPSTSFLFPLITTIIHSQVKSSPARPQTAIFTYSRHLC